MTWAKPGPGAPRKLVGGRRWIVFWAIIRHQSKSGAARLAGVSRWTVQRAIKRDPLLANVWDSVSYDRSVERQADLQADLHRRLWRPFRARGLRGRRGAQRHAA